jgi:hypothetical protein
MSQNLDEAYDGSKRPQTRELKPLERDILTRILNDIFHELRETQSLDSLMFVRQHGGIRMDAAEVPLLIEVRDVLNPRED